MFLTPPPPPENFSKKVGYKIFRGFPKTFLGSENFSIFVLSEDPARRMPGYMYYVFCTNFNPIRSLKAFFASRRDDGSVHILHCRYLFFREIETVE